MVKMWDILKKIKDRQKKEEKPPEEQIPSTTPAPKSEETEPSKKYFSKEPQPSELRISEIVMKETKVASSEESAQLYEEAESLVKEILKENIDYKGIAVQRIIARVEKLADQLILGNQDLLRLAFLKDSQDTNYLISHLLNSSIYAMEIGKAIGYDRLRLVELGISGLLYDIGMVKYMVLANQPRKLSPEEYKKVKNHTLAGAQLLENIPGLSKVIINVAYEHHERIDGSGYPKGLKQGAISEYAKLVGLVDVYEAMVHRRPYRDSYLPFEAMRELINQKIGFEYRLIKLLIERIGIYPIGSYVELNTEEKAEVAKLHYENPLHPVVKIISDAPGQETKETKIVDLTTQPNIYIKTGIRKSVT